MTQEIERSSGNVFADLELPDPSEHRLKAWIVAHVAQRMRADRLTQGQAAERMGLKQPDLSAILNGRFRGYSVERLARCLSALGDEVRLTVRSATGDEDAFVVEAA